MPTLPDGVGAGLGQLARAVGCGDVASHNLRIGKGTAQALHHVDAVVGVAVGQCPAPEVGAGIQQRLGAPSAGAHADGRADAQPSLPSTLACELLGAHHIARCDEADHLAVAIDDRQLLQAVLVEQGAPRPT